MTHAQSLVLITTDCLRADHVGFLGYPRPTTPFLDSLAKESIVFSNAVVAGSPTYYSFPAILASRYPLGLGRDVIGLAPEELTLATALQRAGYATAAFCAGNPYLSEEFGYDQGFDTFRDFLDVHPLLLSERGNTKNNFSWRNWLNSSVGKISRRWKPFATAYDEVYFQYCQHLATPKAGSWEALRRFPSANLLVDQARAWLASVGRKPFFLWLHFMDPHSPYYPNQEALAKLGDLETTPSRARYLNSYWNRSDLSPGRLNRHREGIVELYDAGIRWVDAQIARLIDTLRRFHQWDSCVLAFTADHGEEFLDHQGRYHLPSKLTEEIIRVPLLVRMPGHSSKLFEAPFSLLHLSPTLLDALDLQVPTEFQGRSLWRQLQDGTHDSDAVCITESVGSCTNPFRAQSRLGPRVLSLRGRRYKLLIDFERASEQLFDLEADPGEHFPMPADTEKPTRRRLLELAREHLARPLPPQYPRLRLRSRLRYLPIKSAQTAAEFASACG